MSGFCIKTEYPVELEANFVFDISVIFTQICVKVCMYMQSREILQMILKNSLFEFCFLLKIYLKYYIFITQAGKKYICFTQHQYVIK